MIRTSLFILLLAATSCFARDITGNYTGTYTEDSGDASGTTKITIHKNDDSTWTCNFTFTTSTGDEITPKVTSCSGAGDKLEVDFQTEMQDTTLKVHLVGSKEADGSLKGTYKSMPEGGEPQTGTWKSSPQQ